MNPALALLEPNPSPREGSLHAVVEALCEVNLSSGDAVRAGILPSRETLATVTQQLRAALFPWHFGAPKLTPEGLSYYVGRTLDAALNKLERQIYLGLVHACSHTRGHCDRCAERAAEATRAFAAELPRVRRLLGWDAQAALEGDPAARSADEAIFCYPGMTAIFHHRLAHELFRAGIPLIPRIISELAHATTGIDIHPGAKIGSHFFIDHGTGVVIGETCIIGNRVRIYQGVTLGAKSFPKDAEGRPIKGALRHPIVEDDVVIYAGATVLGRITLGQGATIGGNAWLTESVDAGARVNVARRVRQHFDEGAGI